MKIIKITNSTIKNAVITGVLLSDTVDDEEDAVVELDDELDAVAFYYSISSYARSANTRRV